MSVRSAPAIAWLVEGTTALTRALLSIPLLAPSLKSGVQYLVRPASARDHMGGGGSDSPLRALLTIPFLASLQKSLLKSLKSGVQYHVSPVSARGHMGKGGSDSCLARGSKIY